MLLLLKTINQELRSRRVYDQKIFFPVIFAIISCGIPLSGTGEYIICGSYANFDPNQNPAFTSGQIFVYNPTTGEQIQAFNSFDKHNVQRIAYFNNKGSWQILYNTWCSSLIICDTDGSNVKNFAYSDDTGNWAPNCAALLNADDNNWQMLAGYTNGKIILWDVDSVQPLLIFSGDQFLEGAYGIMAFTLFSSGGITYVAAASCNGTVCIYDLATGQLSYTFFNPNSGEAWFTSVAVFQDDAGFNVIAGGMNGHICCWNINSQALIYNIDTNSHPKTSSIIAGLVLLKNTNKQVLLVPYTYNIDSIQLFDAQTGLGGTNLPSGITNISDMRPYQSNDSIKLVVGFGDLKGSVQVWDIESTTLENQFTTSRTSQNMCLYALGSSINCVTVNGYENEKKETFGTLSTFNVESQSGSISPCIDIPSILTSVTNNEQFFERKDLFAVSHDCIHGSRIPIFNLADIQCINVSNSK